MKKLIITIVNLVIILSLLSGCQQQVTNENQFQYKAEDNKISIISHIDTESTSVTIPETIDGKPVTVLLSEAFYQHTKMVSVVLPQSLIEIQGSPFYRCYSLEQINIPKNVKNIDSNPFFRCNSLKAITVNTENNSFSSVDGVLFDKEVKTLISYPEGMEDENYTVPSTVTKLTIDSFGYHPKFKKLIILSNVVEFPTENMFVYPDEITLVVEQNSKAEEYAKANDLKYEYNDQT